MEIKPIAYIKNDFTEKFGIPRQSGLTGMVSKIIFEEEYRNREAFRGIEQFSHFWLIWNFSEVNSEKWSPTVRPPRLGGNTRMGVFATRSPFRPNHMGLSSVKLEKFEFDPVYGPVIYVSGADIKNDTPIFDIKPYLPYTDCHPEAESGFSLSSTDAVLNVEYSDEAKKVIPSDKIDILTEILEQDPRPQYQNEESRIYGFSFSDMEIKFTVTDDTLTVVSSEKRKMIL